MYNNTDTNYIQVKFKRLLIAQGLAAAFTDHSVKSCCKHIKGSQVMLKQNSEGGTYYSGLIHCKSVWDCPHCSAVIAAGRRDEIKQALDTWKTRGGKVQLVTYTVKHNKADKLETLQNAVNEAYRFTKSGGGYQQLKADLNIIGSIVANEINYSDEFGWHYHRHEIVFYRSEKQFKVYEEYVYKKYYKRLVELGFSALPGIGVNISDGEGSLSNYLAKWGLENELTSTKENYSKTPFQLLDNEEDHYLYVDYTKIMQGKRRLTWSRGLKALLLIDELTDEEIIEKVEQEDLTIRKITYEEWKYITWHGLSLDVLSEAKNNANFNDWYENHISIYV